MIRSQGNRHWDLSVVFHKKESCEEAWAICKSSTLKSLHNKKGIG